MVELKRRRRQRVRLEDFLSLEESHPYGCLPGGNQFFLNDDDHGSTAQSRRKVVAGMEERKWCNDELWQGILGFCDAQTLGRVTASSKYLYVAGHQPELWRDLVLRRCDQEKRVVDVASAESSIQSWKDMYRVLFTGNSSGSHKPICIEGIFSDEYYRTHRCRSFSIPKCWLDPALTRIEDTVPCISIESMTPQVFLEEYEERNQPVILQAAAKSTTAYQKWIDPTYLPSTNMPNKSFRTTSGAAPLPANFSLQTYQTYSSFSYLEESPMYLFDRTALDNITWHDDFFPEFYENCPFWDPSANYGHDLLQHLGASKRPDHTWLIMGPKRSGSVFHIE